MDDPGQSQTVWVAGMGVVSAAGHDAIQTLRSFESSQRHCTQVLPFTSELQCPTFQVEGPLPDLPGRRQRSRTARLMMKAVAEAMVDANIESFHADADRVGVCVGTTVAGQLNSLPFYRGYRETGQPSLEPVCDYFAANLATVVSELLGVRGPRMTIVNACSSGTDAIGVAGDWIRAGLCDVAFAGGADELSQVPLAGFRSLGVMSDQPCRPFDRDRNGLNLGEGAGVVILASDSWAARHDMPRRFELAGFGAACDAYHLTSPHPDGRGLKTAIRHAMRQANCSVDDIDFINAHGTATQENDRVEGALIERMFGPTPFVSTKGYTGHTLGAAGGIEAVFTLLTLKSACLPANVGFENAPPERNTSPVTRPTTLDATCGLSLSLAFGGNNAAVIFRRVP